MNRARTFAKWLALPAALFTLACALLAPVEAGSAPAQKRAQGEQEVDSNSTVRGRVVYDDTSRPVRRARVMLLAEGGSRTEYAALTDGRGDFRIPNVPAGNYYAFVDLPGIISPVGFMSLGIMRAAASRPPDLGEGRRFFDLIEVDGKQDLSITVHARHGAAISGRVLYADGDPAVNVTISLLRRDADGRVQRYLSGTNLVALSGLRTDDRGMFRLTGLPPGEYLIGVSETAEHGSDNHAGRDDFGVLQGMLGQQLLMTFYPSATSLKEAASFKVEAGDERANVDVTIPERALRTITGLVRTRRDARPMPRVRVNIFRRDDPLSPSGPLAFNDPNDTSPNGTYTDEAGRWYLKEIPEGSYTISVEPPEEYEEGTASTNANVSVAISNASNMNVSMYPQPRPKRLLAPTRRDVEVSGGDVSELVIEIAEGARISGTITFEGGGSPRYSNVNVMRVTEGGGGVRSASEMRSIGVEGGRFSVEGLAAGKFFLQPSVIGSEGDVYLKAMTWNGRDLMREPIELAESASVEGVQIVYSRNPARLFVTALNAGGKRLARNASIYVVPVDQTAWTPYTRSLFCMTGDDGMCPVVAPPGEYRVVALPYMGWRPSFEQEVMRRAAAAPRVTLRAGETQQVEVAVPES